MRTIKEVKLNPENSGITGRSMRELRNALCATINSATIVVEVITSGILCGFLVIDRTNGIAYWSGDGFRTDAGGEGGRGYRAACKLIESFGHNLAFAQDFIDEPFVIDNDVEHDKLEFLNIANLITNEDEASFKIASDLIPHY